MTRCRTFTTETVVAAALHLSFCFLFFHKLPDCAFRSTFLESKLQFISKIHFFCAEIERQANSTLHITCLHRINSTIRSDLYFVIFLAIYDEKFRMFSKLSQISIIKMKCQIIRVHIKREYFENKKKTP